jgi:hypothetical protein
MAITNTLIASTNTTAIFAPVVDTAITTIIFCNADIYNDGKITVYCVGTGNVIGTSTMILSNLPLPATETFTLDTEKLILGNGDVIYAQATVDTIGATISSVEI